MKPFKLDLVALESSVAPQLHDTPADIARNACEELASQLRPHVLGARDDEGLEALLGLLLRRQRPAELCGTCRGAGRVRPTLAHSEARACPDCEGRGER